MAPECPLWCRAALMGTRGWFQRSGSSSFEFLLVEGDSVERFDCNVLLGTFCFQLSTAFPCSTVTFRLQSWSPWGHILKSLASKLQVLENCRPWLEDSSIFGILEFL